MWRSRDGSRLVLPKNVLAAWAERYRAGRGDACGGCAKDAVVDEVRRIAGTARRAGSFRDRKNGRRYPVFAGTRRSSPVRLITRPAFGAGSVIVGVDPDPSTWLDGEPGDDGDARSGDSDFDADGGSDDETALEILIGR